MNWETLNTLLAARHFFEVAQGSGAKGWQGFTVFSQGDERGVSGRG